VGFCQFSDVIVPHVLSKTNSVIHLAFSSWLVFGIFQIQFFFAKFFSNRRKVTKLQVDLSGRVKPMCAEHYSEDAETDVTR